MDDVSDIDWAKLVGDLRSSGLTQHEIAQKVGCSQRYISGLAQRKRGSRIGWRFATALIRLRAERLQNSPEAPP